MLSLCNYQPIYYKNYLTSVMDGIKVKIIHSHPLNNEVQLTFSFTIINIRDNIKYNGRELAPREHIASPRRVSLQEDKSPRRRVNGQSIPSLIKIRPRTLRDEAHKHRSSISLAEIISNARSPTPFDSPTPKYYRIQGNLPYNEGQTLYHHGICAKYGLFYCA